MTDYQETITEQSSTDDQAGSETQVKIDTTRMDRLEKALLPYEKQLQKQEKFRKRLGVKEVARPTYERYITGPIERFEKERMAFLCMRPENPYGEELREKFKAQTGYDHYLSSLPYADLDYEDRIGRALADACYRACGEYEPEPFAVTPRDGRLEVKDPAWMSRLIKKIGLMFGADIVRITELDQRWAYKDVDIPHKYAIVAVVQHKPSFVDLAPSYFSWTSSAWVPRGRLSLMPIRSWAITRSRQLAWPSWRNASTRSSRNKGPESQRVRVSPWSSWEEAGSWPDSIRFGGTPTSAVHGSPSSPDPPESGRPAWLRNSSPTCPEPTSAP